MSGGTFRNSSGGPGGFYDGNLTVPTEVEGSGLVSVDPITTAITVRRKYCQLIQNYRPSVPNQPIADWQYPQAILIWEKESDRKGGLTFFDRLYTSQPPSRTEQRLMSFTYPGQSSAKFNAAGIPIGWDPYGIAPPKTRLLSVLANFTYAIVPGLTTDPAIILNPNNTIQPTNITYQGKVVDYIGDVYVAVGTQYTGGNKSLAAYAKQGSTSPATLALLLSTPPYVYSVEMKRYAGLIWEMCVTTVPIVF